MEHFLMLRCAKLYVVQRRVCQDDVAAVDPGCGLVWILL
jgi:hypothetical protein